MIVYVKSFWIRIYFKCPPIDASNVSPYIKAHNYPPWQ